jgi:hypothetical protein
MTLLAAWVWVGSAFAAKAPTEAEVEAEGEAWAQGRDPGFTRRATALCRGTEDVAGCVGILQGACADDRAGAGPEMLDNEVDAVLNGTKVTRKRQRAADAILARET